MNYRNKHWPLNEKQTKLKSVVGLNYGNLQGGQLRPFIQYGHINQNYTIDRQLYKIPNVDHSKWAFLVESAYYGNQRLGWYNETHRAYIDSGNTTIQVPVDIFSQILDETMKALNYDQNKFIRIKLIQERNQFIKAI